MGCGELGQCDCAPGCGTWFVVAKRRSIDGPLVPSIAHRLIQALKVDRPDLTGPSRTGDEKVAVLAPAGEPGRATRRAALGG
ncbi:hypothetical protein SAMN05892883_0399 [Jatrophihabitans sp. GAS493]|nr:hypothetical protein SAMN05892883_0399 [Jatrophihabitans sp. GAS493]